MTVDAIRQLARAEKLKLMEALWEDLSQTAENFQSPSWHGVALAETENRLKIGQEKIVDWESAKKDLAKAARALRSV